MGEIDQEYLFGIIGYIKKNRNKTIYLSSITKTPIKFITHVKYYIDCRPKEYPDVYFDDNFTKIYIS